MKNKLLLLLAMGIAFSTQTLMAQVPGSVAQTFGLSPGFGSSDLRCINIQADGKIIVAGSFGWYKNVKENSIIRLNPDGSKDSTFNNSLFSSYFSAVNSVIIQPDGKFIVGGDFYIEQNGIPYRNIIRLNIDGSVDNSLVIGTGFNKLVKSIALQADGKILVGGDFTTFDGIKENRIIRLNSDGSRDNTFNTGVGFNNLIKSIIITENNKIIIGGDFTTYNGVTKNRLIRLLNDGADDSTFSTGTAFNRTVNAIKIQLDGKIIVAGAFSSYNQISENRLIQLNPDGSKDQLFQAGIGFSGDVNAVEIQSDGKLIVGGWFTSFDGMYNNNIIRLNLDGSKDTTFNIGEGFDGNVDSIKIQPNGKIMVGGDFLSFNNLPASQLIKIDSSGDIDYTFKSNDGPLSGFDERIETALIQPDGKYLLGGWFKSYKSITESRFIRLNSDGTKDNSFNIGLGFNREVTSSCLQSDGKIIVGGDFTSYNGATANRIIRLNSDGSIDSTFNTGVGFNSSVSVIVVQPNGKIIIGGYFESYNGTIANGLIRLNNDGSVDSKFNAGLSGNPWSIAIQSNGKILVGGVFNKYNGITENHLIRLNEDGTKDTSFNIGVGFNYGISCLAIQSDGKILVGGSFTSYKGLKENYIIRLNSDGTKDNTFITGSGFSAYVNAITLLSDGRILVGGAFQHYNNTYNVNGIILLLTNGSRDNSFVPGISFGFNSAIVRSDGKILLDSGPILLNGYNTLSNYDILEDEKVIIYPNPASSQININFNNITDLNGGELKIINSLGQQVATTPITTSGKQTIMQLATWGGSGMYFVQIINPQGIVVDVKKIILQ